MDHDPDRLTLWPSYFDVRRSRRSGRRVAKDAAVKKPDLEGLYTAARAVGLRKIKREANAARPSDPHAREGRLIVSRSGAEADAGASSKGFIIKFTFNGRKFFYISSFKTPNTVVFCLTNY